MKFGWLKDMPDIRDFHVKHSDVAKFKLNERVLPAKYRIAQLPAIKDQAAIGSCTAHAGTYMYETFALQAGNITVAPLSRLFLYKVTRKLSGLVGDTGAYLRDTMKAITLFGIPPEEYWPYIPRDFEKDPTAFEYSLAQNYQALTYYKLDPYGKDGQKIVDSIKLNLDANRACIFGFVVYQDCINERTGAIKMPKRSSSQSGGHAVCAIGWDDAYTVGDSTGAFIFANSWSNRWGDAGYGYLPYDYIRNGLATDWWTMMTGEWADLTVFQPD